MKFEFLRLTIRLPKPVSIAPVGLRGPPSPASLFMLYQWQAVPSSVPGKERAFHKDLMNQSLAVPCTYVPVWVVSIETSQKPDLES